MFRKETQCKKMTENISGTQLERGTESRTIFSNFYFQCNHQNTVFQNSECIIIRSNPLWTEIQPILFCKKRCIMLPFYPMLQNIYFYTELQNYLLNAWKQTSTGERPVLIPRQEGPSQEDLILLPIFEESSCMTRRLCDSSFQSPGFT